MWSPAVELVSLDQAKERVKLSLDFDGEDDALTVQLLIAHEAVLDYVAQRIDEDEQDEWQAVVDEWDVEMVLQRVKGVILEQFAFQYRFRGDDPESQKISADEALCAAAKRLLKRYVDPTVA